MNQQPRHQGYYESIAEASTQLEAMGHSSEFERLLVDNALERTSRSQFAELTVESRVLPPVMNEVHAYPTRFVMQDFDAEFTELTDETGDQWYLTARYHINGTPYRFWSTESESVLETSNLDDRSLRYNFGPETTGRFLIALASSALDRDSEAFIDAVSSQTLTSAATAKTMLNILGERLGTYSSTILANFDDQEHDRALIVKMHETETPRTSGISVEYHLGWEIAAGRPTAMLSTQREVLSRVALSNRFSERMPTTIPPDQLFASLHFGPIEETEGVQFTNQSDPEQYDLISECIMQVLKPRLEPYRDHDR